MYYNETKKNTPTFNSINTFSDYFKTKSINIDEKFNENEIKSLKNFDKKLYDNYTNDFLSSNSKDKNYKISYSADP